MGITKIRKFIKDNKLSFKGTGSSLNGNCTILAGFVCYDVEGINYELGKGIIRKLGLSKEATEELLRVYKYAFNAGYENFWETAEAKEKYIF